MVFENEINSDKILNTSKFDNIEVFKNEMNFHYFNYFVDFFLGKKNFFPLYFQHYVVKNGEDPWPIQAGHENVKFWISECTKFLNQKIQEDSCSSDFYLVMEKGLKVETLLVHFKCKDSIHSMLNILETIFANLLSLKNHIDSEFDRIYLYIPFTISNYLGDSKFLFDLNINTLDNSFSKKYGEDYSAYYNNKYLYMNFFSLNSFFQLWKKHVLEGIDKSYLLHGIDKSYFESVLLQQKTCVRAILLQSKSVINNKVKIRKYTLLELVDKYTKALKKSKLSVAELAYRTECFNQIKKRLMSKKVGEEIKNFYSGLEHIKEGCFSELNQVTSAFPELAWKMSQDKLGSFLEAKFEKLSGENKSLISDVVNAIYGSNSPLYHPDDKYKVVFSKIKNEVDEFYASGNRSKDLEAFSSEAGLKF